MRFDDDDPVQQLLSVLHDLDVNGLLADTYGMTDCDAPLEQAIQVWADAGYPGADELDRDELDSLREEVRDLREASDAPHPLDQRIEVDTMAPNATGHALEVVDRAAHRVDPKHWLWDLRELLTAIHHDYVRRTS